MELSSGLADIIIIIILLDLLARFRPRTINKLSEGDSDAEYVFFRRDRSSTVESRGGGVLLYVREELSPVEFISLTEYPEHVWCRLGDVGRRGLLLGVCYRTASQVFGYDINARLRELLIELKDDRVLLMGDFNYPGVDWDKW